jgi:hypothetical protein
LGREFGEHRPMGYFQLSAISRAMPGNSYSTVTLVLRCDVDDMACDRKVSKRGRSKVDLSIFKIQSKSCGVLVPPSCRRLPRRMQISSLNGSSCLEVQCNRMNTHMAYRTSQKVVIVADNMK